MINYLSIIEFLKSEEYVDKTGCFERLLADRYTTLENCGRTGSSLFLKTFACFLDESIDSKNVLGNLDICHSEFFQSEVNSYRTLYLDFSDFDADGFDTAIGYVKKKMSEVYKQFYDLYDATNNSYFDCLSQEQALDVIEEITSIEDLKASFRRLLLKIGGVEAQRRNKVAVLIDNLVRLETVSSECGYGGEMCDFLRDFIVEDVYKYCDVFLQLGDAVETSDSWFTGRRYLAYRYFSVFANDLYERYPEMVVSETSRHKFDYTPMIGTDGDEWPIKVAKGRARIKQAKVEEERRRLEGLREEKIRYAKELSPMVPRISPNIGIREKRLDKQSLKYVELNDFLRSIYKKFYPRFDIGEFYGNIQEINKDESLVVDVQNLENILEKLHRGNGKWMDFSAVSSSGSWVQVTYERVDGQDDGYPGRPENLKVYACFDNTDVEQVFISSLKYLLENAENTFAAKIAVCNRRDQMCYWVSQKDFKHLEDFFNPYADTLVKSMPFVAYKGKLGISKDFPGADDSHNLTQAHIISDYLRSVKSVGEIDLEEMYNNYIAKWNADVSEEDSWLGFKGNSALSFVVVLDTLDFILSGKDVSEQSFLLSGEERIWRILSRSRCWADVNERWNNLKG